AIEPAANFGVAVAAEDVLEVRVAGSVGEREQAAEANRRKRTRRIVGGPLYLAACGEGHSSDVGRERRNPERFGYAAARPIAPSRIARQPSSESHRLRACRSVVAPGIPFKYPERCLRVQRTPKGSP